MYRGVTIRLYHQVNRDRLNTVLQRLRNAGCNALSIIPHQYSIIRSDPNNPKHDVLPVPAPIKDHDNQYIFSDLDEGGTKWNLGLVGNTTPLADVRMVCEVGRDQGFQVLLKPHIDPLRWDQTAAKYFPAGWRGYLDITDSVQAFQKSYCEDFLGPYVQVAKELGLPLLSLGVEYYWIAHEQGAGFWTGVADWVVAQGYTGKLTYSANWGWGEDAEFQRLAALWRHPAISYIGVDAYYHLWPVKLTEAMVQGGWHPEPGTPDADPTVEQLISGWRDPHLVPSGQPIDVSPYERLINLCKATGKPLVFTEVGYSNRLGAAWEPGRDNYDTDKIDDPRRQNCLQERLFEAFRQVWEPTNCFAGYFWWDASLDPAQDPAAIATHNILANDQPGGTFSQGTRLELRLFRDFAAPRELEPTSRELEPAPRELEMEPTVAPATRPAPRDREAAPFLPIRAMPTIALADFARILREHESPAIDKASPETLYMICVRHRVDPRLALAYFGQTSDYGTARHTSRLRNWGMIWDKQAGQPAHYHTWEEGLEAWLTSLTAWLPL